MNDPEPGVVCFEPQSPAAGRTPTPADLGRLVERIGAEVGLARVGVAPATEMPEARARLARWLEEGLGAGLGYLSADRDDPRRLLGEAKSVIVGALVHGPFGPEAEPGAGSVAAYARGNDYHLVLKDKLRALGRALATAAGRAVTARMAVDTAPLLERELAARAGIGFIGKNTMLIAPGLGSALVLGELIVDLEIAPGTRVAPGCGACRACLDACPTQAFVEAHRLDARRCISFLTIEQPKPLPVELRSGIGSHVFGCDVCQSVCPYNASASPPVADPELDGRIPMDGLELVELLSLGNAGYRKLVKRSALRRVTRNVLSRNAAVALSGWNDPAAAQALERALESHPSALVRGHAAWALARLGFRRSRAFLERAAQADPDPDVRAEAVSALAALDEKSGNAYR